MLEYVRGWKRKLGVATLTAACLLMAGWLRSRTVYDELLFNRETSALSSMNGELMFGSRSDEQFHTGNLEWDWGVPPWRTMLLSEGVEAHILPEISWRWQWCGFGSGEITNPPPNCYKINLWTVPYWSLVTPLAVVSTWLLLSKPGTTIEPSITEIGKP